MELSKSGKRFGVASSDVVVLEAEARGMSLDVCSLQCCSYAWPCVTIESKGLDEVK
jgi:hypothetical protein